MSKTLKKAINLKVEAEASEHILLLQLTIHRIPLAANSSLTLRR